MNGVLVPDWLLAWPQFTGLLGGYLARLGKLPSDAVEESWLNRACRSARERPEAREHLDALEEAASLCDKTARRTLSKKFEGTLPRSPIGWSRDHDDHFLDVTVELAAYRWLCAEYPAARLKYVVGGAGRSPDLQVALMSETVGLECKNLHMSTDVRDDFDAGKMVSGAVMMSDAFVRQVQEKIDHAMLQLAAHPTKIVFLNVTPDPVLWPIWSEVGAAIRSLVPAGCKVVVFRNYGWTEPTWVFGG